ncbi:MAG: hypothetical protein QME07_04625 [bacterium]|nr:hypothetical protein [bacterium]
MKRFILNLSICLVIAMCSIAMMGCFGKKKEPVTETPQAEESIATEEEAAPAEEGSEAGEEG